MGKDVSDINASDWPCTHSPSVWVTIHGTNSIGVEIICNLGNRSGLNGSATTMICQGSEGNDMDYEDEGFDDEAEDKEHDLTIQDDGRKGD